MDLLGRVPKKAAEEEEVAAERAEAIEGLVLPGTAAPGRLYAAGFVFAEKCGKCHHLRRPFENPRPADQWAPLIESMRGFEPGWIADADATEIELYLTNDYGPGS
jgi:hypothetical protein